MFFIVNELVRTRSLFSPFAFYCQELTRTRSLFNSLRVRVRHGPPGHAWIAYGQDEDDAKSSCRNGPTIGMEKLLAKAAGRIRQCNSFWSASPYQSHALSMISRFSTPKPDPALCTGQDLCSDSRRRRRRRRRQVMTAVWLLHVPVEMHPPHLH